MKREYIIVGIIFLLVLGIRIFFAFQTPYFSSDEAYYNIRQLVHIKETFFPIVQDDLSYGGKILYLPPLFYYILAFLSFIFRTEFVGKFFPNLFASTIVIVAYLIASELSKNKEARIFTALLAGFMPLFFSETLNSISLYSFFIPLVFFNIYCMMKVIDHRKDFIGYSIASLLLLRMTTPGVIFLVFSLLLYLLLITIEKLKRTRAETELIMFSTFAIILTLLIFFKNALLNYGISILWQNIPKELLKNYFANANLLTVIYLIGIIPFVFGLCTIYKHAFIEKDKKTYLLISFAIVIALFMWLRLIELNMALILIGFVMTFLFAKSYHLIQDFIESNKLKTIFMIFFLFLVIISSVVPSLILAFDEKSKSFSQKEIEALLWLRKNTNSDDIILSTLNEGHLISGIALRKNFIDSNFMFVNDIDQRLIDTYKIYTTTSQTQRVGLLNEYGINYIYFSDRAKGEYKIDSIPYLDDKCFEDVFNNSEVIIYKSICVIEEK